MVKNLTEQQISAINTVVSRKLGIFCEFTEEEQSEKRPHPEFACLHSEQVDQNVGALFARCFYNVRVTMSLFRPDLAVNRWVGELSLGYKYHEAASNGARMMLNIEINDNKVELTDRMEESAMYWKRD